jgi:hypothetical protein
MPASTQLERAPRDTVRVVILGDDDEIATQIPSDRPTTVTDLLSSLGIGNRSGQWFLDGRPALPGAEVHPNSEVILLPLIRGG